MCENNEKTKGCTGRGVGPWESVHINIVGLRGLELGHAAVLSSRVLGIKNARVKFYFDKGAERKTEWEIVHILTFKCETRDQARAALIEVGRLVGFDPKIDASLESLMENMTAFVEEMTISVQAGPTGGGGVLGELAG